MSLFPHRLFAVTGFLALTLLASLAPGRAGEPQISGATLARTTPLTASPANVVYTTTPQGANAIVFRANDLPLDGVALTPGLYGSVNDLSFKNTKKGATRAKATVDLANTSSKSLRNVTATVYLSDDNTLSADDTKVVTLNLSDYVAMGKVAKNNAVQLPFNYKVPSLVASYLNGKYLIIVLAADNLGSLVTTPVVVGSITLP